MDFEDSPEEAAFRAKARAWLAEHAPRFTPAPDATDADIARLLRGWQAMKFDAGFEGVGVPPEFGGRAGNPLEFVLFKQEEAAYPIAQQSAPYLTVGIGNAVPVMLHHAVPEVIQQLVRPTLRADLTWCQLFSEPGAGNDVAGIRTRAVRDGDDWVINGQKVWSSGAHVADWALLLTRSDPTVPKHKGLCFFLLDMKLPGVDVRPLKQITGRAEFNEVFLTDVRIPDRYRVGAPGEGWKVVLTTLMNERLGALTGASVASFGGIILDPLVRLAQRVPGETAARAIDDANVRERIANYHVATAGLKHLGSRMMTQLAQGELPGPESGIAKTVMTRLLQEMAAFGMDIAGPAGAVADVDDIVAQMQDSFLGSVGYRQGGGTEDINKSILAERVLGLPADPRVDKDIPFDRMPLSV